MGADRLEVLAAALLAQVTVEIDLTELARVDPDELALALRRAVADLEPAEQRVRLGTAFDALVRLGGVSPHT